MAENPKATIADVYRGLVAEYGSVKERLAAASKDAKAGFEQQVKDVEQSIRDAEATAKAENVDLGIASPLTASTSADA